MDKLEFNTYPKQLKFNADEGKLLPVGDQNIEYNSAAKIGEGTDGIIFRIVTHFQNEYSEKLRGFVYKIFRDPKEKDDSVRIFNYLKSLHNPHIHIPPTYRATENGTLMTDLTDNGKNLVLSANDISTEEQIVIIQLLAN